MEQEPEPLKEPTTDTMVVVPWGLVCGLYTILSQICIIFYLPTHFFFLILQVNGGAPKNKDLLFVSLDGKIMPVLSIP